MKNKPTKFSTLALVLLVSASAHAVIQPEALMGMGKQSTEASAEAFQLGEPGQGKLIDYSKYGTFHNAGTPHFEYRMRYRNELGQAVGEGIYPNTWSLKRDPSYHALKDAIEIPEDERGFYGGPSNEARKNFYRWAASKQPEGVKLWFVAESFKDAGMWVEALNAYQALLVHFPATTRLAPSGGWGLALGSQAIQRIKLICRRNPQLNLDFVGGEVQIKNPGQLDEKVLVIKMGQFVDRRATEPKSLRESGIKRYVGKGKVRLVQYNNNHWQMLVDGRPYFIKGMAYGFTRIGLAPHTENMEPWENSNDPKIYEKTWWDKNRNNRRDDGETNHDGELLQAMGCNTLRLYYGASNKQALRNLYEKHGIRMLMGFSAGVYALDSGAAWVDGTDYTDAGQQETMLANLEKMIMEHKDEPYTLAWCFGNENNYGGANNSPKYPATFANFLQKCVKLAHRLDPNHPVIYSNGDLGFLEHYIRFLPDLDILGANVYRGKDGMGDLYERVSTEYDKPVVITEFGAPAFTNGTGENEDAQSEYVGGSWQDIYYHRAGTRGAGNSLGGVVFQWKDEWWKSGDTDPFDQQDVGKGQGGGPFADGMFHEEWFGITSMGNGHDSPWMTQTRKTYFTLKKLWTGR